MTKEVLRIENGDVREFVDKLWGGEELIYTYNGKNTFLKDIPLKMVYIALNCNNGSRKGKCSGM